MTIPKLLVAGGAVMLAVVGLTAGSASPARAAGACLTMPLVFETMTLEGCPSDAMLERAMDAPMAVGPQSPETGRREGLTLTSPDNDSIKKAVHTCRDYQAATSGGWFALTQFDMNVEGFMQVACGSLLALQESARAGASQFEAEAVGFQTLSLLPADILPALAPDTEDALAQLKSAGFSVGSMVATGDVLTRAASATQLELAYAGVASTYGEVARGDFNADGDMDLLVYARHEAINGSLRWYELFALAYLPGALTFQRFEPAGLEKLSPAQ